MYGVILCPQCKRPQGVLLSSKTKTCQCGKRLQVSRAPVLFSTDDPRELPEALGRVRAQLSGLIEEFEEFLEEGGSEKVGRPVGQQRKRAMEVLKALSAQRSGFLLSDAQEVLDALGLEGAKILEALVAENLLYEFKPGHYKVA